MNKIGLGTVKFGLDYGISSTKGQVPFDEARNIIAYAEANNIDLVDTAPSYGESEKVLGKVNISKMNIITKTRHFSQSRIHDDDVQLIQNDLTNSLEHLGVKGVYGLLFHNANDLLKPGGSKLYETLKKLKGQKKIKKIGISIYEQSQIEQVLSLYDLDIIQIPFNIFDRRLLESGMIDILHDQGIEIHSRSVFLQGLLLMSEKDRPSIFTKWNKLWKVWHEWLNDNRLTALEASLRYVLSFTQISKVLIGVETTMQLQQILNSSKGTLPEVPDELSIIDPLLLNPTNWKET